MKNRYKATEYGGKDCTIAGCVYSALYVVKRPGNDSEVAVCRKCCEDLTGSYKWTFVRTMTKAERIMRNA